MEIDTFLFCVTLDLLEVLGQTCNTSFVLVCRLPLVCGFLLLFSYTPKGESSIDNVLLDGDGSGVSSKIRSILDHTDHTV